MITINQPFNFKSFRNESKDLLDAWTLITSLLGTVFDHFSKTEKKSRIRREAEYFLMNLKPFSNVFSASPQSKLKLSRKPRNT